MLRYKLFSNDLLLLELVNAQSVPDATSVKTIAPENGPAVPQPKVATGKDKSVEEWLSAGSTEFRELYDQIVSYLNSLGDDVQEKRLKLYTAFRRLKNFACIVVYANRFLVMLKIDPATVTLEEGFSRDVTHIGHWALAILK